MLGVTSRRAARWSAVAIAAAAWLTPRAAHAQGAPAPYSPSAAASPEPPLASFGPIDPESPVYRALGGTMVGAGFGASTWLASGAVSSRDLKGAMLQPLPIGLALGAAAAGATAGALLITDDRRFRRLHIPAAGGVLTGTLFALFGGGAWYLSCKGPESPERDACQRRAGRFFAGSLALGTFLGTATGLGFALAVAPRSAERRSAARVFVGPGSLLVKF